MPRAARSPPNEPKQTAAESVTRFCFGGLYASAALFLKAQLIWFGPGPENPVCGAFF